MTLVPNEAEQALNRQYDVYAAAREEYRKKIDEQAARIERLEKEIKTAIRQFEDGNRLECHRTLCTVIYGKQY